MQAINVTKEVIWNQKTWVRFPLGPDFFHCLFSSAEKGHQATKSHLIATKCLGATEPQNRSRSAVLINTHYSAAVIIKNQYSTWSCMGFMTISVDCYGVK